MYISTPVTGHLKSVYPVSGNREKLSGYRVSVNLVSGYRIITIICFEIRTYFGPVTECPDIKAVQTGETPFSLL